MLQIFVVTKVKNKLGEILKQAYAYEDQIIVEKNGIPVAAITPVSLYNPIYLRQGDAKPQVTEKLDVAAETTSAHRNLQTESERIEYVWKGVK